MKIEILHLIEGARKAVGCTVIIDVFRAFSLESYLYAGGAEKIIAVGDKDLALSLGKKIPNAVLIGERRGVKLPDFDFGNSPTDIIKADFNGKTVVHTTSAGTQGVAAAECADVVLGCSLVNAAATAKYIKKQGYETVSIVAMGLDGIQKTDEDELCAEYLKALLSGRKIELADKIEKIKTTSGAKFFDKEKQSVFPNTDFYLCTEVDKFNFALIIRRNHETGENEVEKIEV